MTDTGYKVIVGLARKTLHKPKNFKEYFQKHKKNRNFLRSDISREARNP